MKGELAMQKAGGAIASPRSAYQPGNEIRALTEEVKQAYEDGENTLSSPLEEYNGRSFVQQTNEAQRTWLSHPDAPYVGDDEWRWNGVRPLTRNRVISTAAHLTAKLLYPKSFAQNDDQEEDREAAYAMDALVEYNIRRSNYETAFLFGVISGLVNPINYFSVNYCEAWQEAWVGGERQRVLDDVFSGFQHGLIPVDEVLFGNAFIYDWQKQDFNIRKRRVSYEEMEGKFGAHDNWGHVKRGCLTMVNDDGFFYDVEDVNDGMVGHVNYKHRRSDLEVDFVNGIYLSNSNAAYNPFLHRTNKDKPEYDIVKYGFEPIDAMRFAGYKSLVDKMSGDQDAADRQWQDFFDASRLATFTPLVTMGAGKIDRSVVAPAAVTEIGKEAEMKPVQVSSPMAALGALREAERSGNETSVDPQMGGQQQGPEKTKAEAMILQQNADTNLAITAKMIAVMVKNVGRLMVHDIIRYQTIGQAGEILGETTYRSFVVDGRLRSGKNKTTYVKLTDRFAGSPMSPEEKEMEEYKLMDKAGDDKEIVEINPGKFAQLDFLLTIDAEQLMHRNDAFERAFKLSAYDKAIANPLVQKDPEAQLKITRDFLFEPIMRGEASKYLPNLQKVLSQLTPEEAPGYPQKGLPERVVGGRVTQGVV